MPVSGMGGYFFRANDPEKLKTWYREHLGIGGGMGTDPVTGHSNEWVWYHEGGPMVFSPFEADTDYFASERFESFYNFHYRIPFANHIAKSPVPAEL